MKSIVLILIFFSSVVFSCKKQVRPEIEYLFSEPIPSFKSDLISFPKKYLGVYVNDNEQLIINENHILRKTTFYPKWNKNKLSNAELDSLKNNYYNDPKFRYSIVHEGKDSIEAKITQIDTIFMITPYKKVRKWKDFFYLNEMTDTPNWRTDIVNFKKDSLYFGDFIDYNNMDSLVSQYQINRVLDSFQNSKFYRLEPTKDQLRMLSSLKHLTGYQKIE